MPFRSQLERVARHILDRLRQREEHPNINTRVAISGDLALLRYLPIARAGNVLHHGPHSSAKPISHAFTRQEITIITDAGSFPPNLEDRIAADGTPFLMDLGRLYYRTGRHRVLIRIIYKSKARHESRCHPVTPEIMN